MFEHPLYLFLKGVGSCQFFPPALSSQNLEAQIGRENFEAGSETMSAAALLSIDMGSIFVFFHITSKFKSILGNTKNKLCESSEL